MGDCMTFPDTVEEFMEQYKIVDSEQIYTNGTELVPIFRMKQWFEHQLKQNRGRWIVDPIASNIFRCSVCGQDAPVDPTGETEYKSNFCPSCGAYNMWEEHKKDKNAKGDIVGFYNKIIQNDIDALTQMQSAQKTGRWLNVGRFKELIVRKCNKCGYYTTTYNPPNYCEFCGSKNVGDNNVDDQCKCCKDLECLLEENK